MARARFFSMRHFSASVSVVDEEEDDDGATFVAAGDDLVEPTKFAIFPCGFCNCLIVYLLK